MKVTKYNLFFSWNYEKEEQWLNELSRQGLQLVSVSYIRYEFVVDETKAYEYRLEHLDEMPSDFKSINYIETLEKSGIEYVCSFERWVYFRKEAGLGAFELLSDPDSKIAHYNRILALSGIVVLNALILLINSLCTLFNIFILNLVITIIMGLLFLLGVASVIMLYSRVIKLKKEKRSPNNQR